MIQFFFPYKKENRCFSSFLFIAHITHRHKKSRYTYILESENENRLLFLSRITHHLFTTLIVYYLLNLVLSCVLSTTGNILHSLCVCVLFKGTTYHSAFQQNCC